MRTRRTVPWLSIFGVVSGALTLIFCLFVASGVNAQSGITDFTSVRASAFWMAAPKQTRVLTANGTLNALGTHQPISSTAAIGTSGANITVKAAGSILILRNVGAQTITFTETGTLISAGNIALGANDSATLLSDGTNWVQIAASNN